MPRFLNTDNGRVIEVAEDEAFIYERASNFECVPEKKPARAHKEPPPVVPEVTVDDVEFEPKKTPPAKKQKKT